MVVLSSPSLSTPVSLKVPTPRSRHFSILSVYQKSISRDTISQNLIVPNRIAFFLTGIAGVAFDGIDPSVFHSCNDAHVVWLAVLSGFIVPIEEDDHARCGFCGVVGPLASLLEPADTVGTAGEFGDHAGIDVTALVGTPADKAGTPFNTALKAVLGPIGGAAVTHLGQGHRDDLFIAAVDSVQYGRPKRAVVIAEQFIHLQEPGLIKAQPLCRLFSSSVSLMDRPCDFFQAQSHTSSKLHWFISLMLRVRSSRLHLPDLIEIDDDLAQLQTFPVPIHLRHLPGELGVFACAGLIVDHRHPVTGAELCQGAAQLFFCLLAVPAAGDRGTLRCGQCFPQAVEGVEHLKLFRPPGRGHVGSNLCHFCDLRSVDFVPARWRLPRNSCPSEWSSFRTATGWRGSPPGGLFP